jgi:uncharacterized cupin superfamily protein
MSQSISLIRSGLDVKEALAEIATHPEAWNQYKLRTESYGTPHTQVSDIWVRYNPWRNFTGDAAAFVLEQHESEWYPVVVSIPAVIRLVDQVMQEVGGKELGGVLITKIPPGGEVAPHIDHGWHSRYYEKFAVQLMGNQDQVFWFEDSELRPGPGDLYTFDNSKLHAVYNWSDEDRMTLIICIRR